MISVASTLLLVSMVFGTVPAAWAAPVGTRNLDVRSMRRMDARELTGMRREHHSATSVVPRDADVPVPVVARAGAPEPVQPDPATEKTSKPKLRRHHAKNEEKGADAKPRAMPRFKRDAVPRHERAPSASNPEVVARKEDATSSNIAREDGIVKRMLVTPTNPGSVDKGGKPDAEKRDVPVASQDHPVKEPKPDHPIKRDAPAAEPAESSTPKVASRNHYGGNVHKEGVPSTETPDGNPRAKREEAKEAATKREETNTKLIKPIAVFRRALAFEDLD